MRPLIRSRRVVVPLAVLALAGTGVAAYGASGSDAAARYRTTTVTRGDIAQELQLSGTISPSGRSDLAFGADGTVARVRVAQGEEVRRGQVIAVLDRAALRAEVDRAKADLADAEAQLAEDRDAQTTAVATATASSGAASQQSSQKSTKKSSKKAASGTPSPATPGTESTGAEGTGASAATLAQLTAQQDAVLAAQTAAGTALDTAADRLTAQQQACADPVEVVPSEAEGTEPEAPATAAVLSDDCTAALVAVQSAQAEAADAQSALQEALQTLGATLTAALGSVSASTAPSSTPTTEPTTEAAPTASAAAAAPSGGATPTRTVTAATLAQDQAAIDKAAAALASARADLRGAVVKAPADGTVVALSVSARDRVSAGDDVVTLVAPGLTTATVAVTAAQAAQLATGAVAQVTPAGAGTALPATIGRIEHTASTSTSGSSTTYAVEVVLDDRDLTLADGMAATVSIVVGSADDVLVVPASALSDGSVTVLDGTGEARRNQVTTGLVGATKVEITDGLEEGDRIALADLDAGLPSGESEQQGRGGLSGLGGGGGGGFPGGGPPSGVMMPR